MLAMLQMMPERFFTSRSGLRALGGIARLKSLVRSQRFVQPRGGPPRIIGIIGVSGAGKSTFLRQIRHLRPSPSFWATKKEIFALQGRPDIRDCAVDERRFALLEEKIEAIRTSGRVDHLKVRNFYNAFNFYFDEIFLENAELPCHVVEDEGYFHVFLREVMRQCGGDVAAYREIARRHAFVVVRCDPESALRNLSARRAAGGKILIRDAGLDDRRVLERTEADARDIDAFVRLAKAAEVPVLEIAGARGARENARAFEAAFG